jgi:hypothetical protein
VHKIKICKEDIMKYIPVLMIIPVLLLGCAVKKNPASALVHHLKQMEKIFEKNKDDTSKLSEELAAYSETNMKSMQDGVKALYDKMEKVKDDPLGAFDLLGKITEISSIIVRVRNEYGGLLDDPGVKKAFTGYQEVFSSMETIGKGR